MKADMKIIIAQWIFHEGSIEKMGTIMNETQGKMCMLMDEASRLWNNVGQKSTGGKEQSPLELFLLEGFNGNINVLIYLNIYVFYEACHGRVF